MAKHLLLFVHGMGKHDAHSHEAGLKVLKTAFAEYPLLKNNFSFDQQFEAVPIVYDEPFNDLRKKWRDDLDAIQKTLGKNIDADDSDARTSLDKQIGDLPNGASPENISAGS